MSVNINFILRDGIRNGGHIVCCFLNCAINTYDDLTLFFKINGYLGGLVGRTAHWAQYWSSHFSTTHTTELTGEVFYPPSGI